MKRKTIKLTMPSGEPIFIKKKRIDYFYQTENYGVKGTYISLNKTESSFMVLETSLEIDNKLNEE